MAKWSFDVVNAYCFRVRRDLTARTSIAAGNISNRWTTRIPTGHAPIAIPRIDYKAE
jgi:hypothetical protein